MDVDGDHSAEVAVAEQHPIQVVVRRTGLSADVLRAWERRYGVVEPARSPTGRRLYSDADIERLRLLHRAVRGGRAIGQLSGMATAELRSLVREDEAEEGQSPVPTRESPSGASMIVAECLAAVEHLDAAALEERLQRAASDLGAASLLEGVIVPMLEAVGAGWVDGRYSITQEHLVSAVVRQVIGGLLRGASGDAARPLALFATPSGERHELGALMAAAMAALQGWRVLYLGADLPMDDLGTAVAVHRPRVVALSVVSAEVTETLPEQVASLKPHLSAETTLLVGGRGAAMRAGELAQLGAVTIHGLAGFRELLSTMGAASRPAG